MAHGNGYRFGLAATSARENAFGPILGPALVSNAAAIAGSFNPTQFGYFGGGGNPSTDASTIQRIEYANDTVTTSRRAILTRKTDTMGTAGNSFFGYFAGGDGTPSDNSTVDRMQYANDTATTLVRGPLSSQRRDLAGAGNINFGYFVGGEVMPGSNDASTVDRIDYFSDTATALVKGPLTINTEHLKDQ